MRKPIILSAVLALALAGCGGGGGGSTNAQPPAPQTSAPQSGLVTPQFTIVIPGPGTSSSARSPKGQRRPNFVSTATKSVTITLVSVNGSTSNLPHPTSVTTDIDNSGGACNSGCVVNGPPSPPGVPDAYTITTFDATGGTGNVLDKGAVTFTPTAGQNNITNVTLNGVPFTVTIAGVPANWSANTAGQTTNLTVTVKDHAGQTITGTYNTSVRITDPDAETTNGTHLTGTHVGAGCTNSCVDLTTDADVVTLNYGGLAENPVVLASSNADVTADSGTAGTGTFTPLLKPILPVGCVTVACNGGGAGTDTNPTTSLGGDGIDLFTTDNTSPVGYTGTVTYFEQGYTNTPYNKVLSATAGTCSAGGPVTAYANVSAPVDAANATNFTYTANAAVAGACPFTVTDGLTDHTNTAPDTTTQPTYQVTYTTSQIKASAKQRHTH